ncbi:hypothetical protein [Lactobacillus taiwanensis]|uniref:hypothetical protein n=1 Tax=Lactobacillus taiwanensis TaxID=508451 RepID=UPI00242E5086|nr:hypothetical protein [Lactobacillus taiwanensis]
MNNPLIVIDGKLPWGKDPLAYGAETLTWKIICIISWLLSFICGFGSFIFFFVISLIPEVKLGLYEFRRNKQFGWLIRPVLNTMKSLGQIKENRPVYRTIFGYNKIDTAPKIYVSKVTNTSYKLLFEANGCPNADKDLLPLLQRELHKYEVLSVGDVRKEYLIRKRRKRGSRLNNDNFY